MVKTPRSHCRGARIRFLVGEIRSCMPHSTDKKKKIILLFKQESCVEFLTLMTQCEDES